MLQRQCHKWKCFLSEVSRPRPRFSLITFESDMVPLYIWSNFVSDFVGQLIQGQSRRLNMYLVITEQNRKIEECLNSIAKFEGRIEGLRDGRSDLETESIKGMTPLHCRR